MACPKNDAIVWYFQSSRFVPKENSDYYFGGTSQIIEVDHLSFDVRVCPGPDWQHVFLKAVLKWVNASMDDRTNINQRLGYLRSALIERI